MLAQIVHSAAADRHIGARKWLSCLGFLFLRATAGGPAELAGYIARASRQATTAVAGNDLTFTSFKSVSVSWALADAPVARVIEAAHDASMDNTLGWIERHDLFTRCGRDGVQQIDVTGMLAARFTHGDARSGDPNLHTYVAVSNKVPALDGRWLAIGAGTGQDDCRRVGAVQHPPRGTSSRPAPAAIRGRPRWAPWSTGAPW